MAIKLTNIRPLGRFVNKETGKAYNVKKGRRVGRSTDHLFYLYLGSRQFITDADFYSDKWEEENHFLREDYTHEDTIGISLKNAEKAETWHLENKEHVSNMLLGDFDMRQMSVPKHPSEPEKWSAANWNWYLFDLVIN